MTYMTAGEAILNDPTNAIVQCKTCKIILKGGSDIIDHLDAHK